MGGTFDPVHRGHLELAQYAMKMCSLSEIIFIPAYHPPHKNIDKLTSFAHRVEMLRLAIEGIDCYTLSSLEKQLVPPSYTIDMLTAFRRERRSDEEFYFIIGIDAFLEINSWKAYKRVLEETHFIVSARKGYTVDELHAFLHSFGYWKKQSWWQKKNTTSRIHYLDCDIIEASSSEIREKLADGVMTEDWLPAPVVRYIQAHNIYERSK